jgi:agmatine/peptidylarginine deiminase
VIIFAKIKFIAMIRILTFLFLISLSVSIYSQDDIPVWKKLKYLSEEEMYLELSTGRDFVETDPPEGEIRNIAEFDPMEGVLVRYPFGVPVTLLKEIAEDAMLIVICRDQSEESDVLQIFENYQVNLDNCQFLYAPTNSWWVRDYGPWFIYEGDNEPGIVDFPYNRPRPQDNEIPGVVAASMGIDLYGMNIYHTGGNYMTDGLGKSSSTDLVIEENPALTEEQINNKFRSYLAIDNYYVLPDPLDDYIKHIDCWGKFLTPGKVIIGMVPETDYRFDDFEQAASFFETTISAYGVPYEVYRVFTPGKNETTPYTNSLIVNNKVFVPISGSEWDDEALAAYEAALPGYEIIGIYHWGWYNTDALHCRAKGIADLGMLYVDHKPVLGSQYFAPQIRLEAEITPYSGMEVYPDSVFLHYRINEDDFINTNFTDMNDGSWECVLGGLEPGDRVAYYIEARDQSGRIAMHPFIGQPDPHEFVMDVFVPELLVNPDTLVFNNYDKLINGLDASIFNNMFAPTLIESIELPENPSYQIKLIEGPTLPYTLPGTSTLALNIAFDEPLPEMGTLLTDSILIKTTYFTYSVIFTIDRTGVPSKDIYSLGKVKVYPNPASDFLLIDIELHKADWVTFKLMDEIGRIILEKRSFLNPGIQRIRIDLENEKKSGLIPGSYFYTISTADFEKTAVLIIE